MELPLTEIIHYINAIILSCKLFGQYDFKNVEERTASLVTRMKLE
jgi:hypothetical protein